jgi:hypothetical protein
MKPTLSGGHDLEEQHMRVTRCASCSRPKGPQEPHTDRASWAQGIFVDPAILHNHRKVLVGVFDEPEIF